MGVLGPASHAPNRRATPTAQALGQHLRREEVRLDEPAEAPPSWSLRLGMIAVCGMGRPSGWRNSAVTANQSANAPTIAASAVART